MSSENAIDITKEINEFIEEKKAENKNNNS